MRRVPIRMKLAGALVIPLAALVVVTTLEVLDSLSQARDVHTQADLATSAIGPPSLLSRIEDERNAAAIVLLDLADAVALPVEDNAEARANTNEALATLTKDLESRSDAVANAYAEPLAAMSQLDDIRAEIDASTAPRNTSNLEFAVGIFGKYSALMDGMFDANQQVTVDIKDTKLRRGAELIDLSARQTDLLARLLRDDLEFALGGDNVVADPAEIRRLADRLGQLRLNEDLIQAKAEGDYRPLADALFENEPVKTFPGLIDQVIVDGNPNIMAVADSAAGDDPETFGYTVFRRAVNDQLQSDADAIERRADSHLVRYLALAIAAMLAALIVTVLVSRSITRPLRVLTRQAKEMSTERLPSVVFQILETPLGDDVEVPETRPIVVKTRDEVGDVAKALNTVQDAAVELAVEQAVLRRNIADSFVNLGRRNQNLLGRQLDFITELESHETDPDILASLFRLDHLATRMRRNAESLLVLAGIEPPRKWAAPVRLADVIRAALGEVEDYQRVTIRNVEPATVMGSAAADLAHLIAEFVENALTFSPPDQSVEIRGRARSGGYTLAVIDNGFGMSAADIDQANRRLAGAESFTIAPSKYLGHYVAGNLAARHGIHVTLGPSPGTGVTATIELPGSLLTADTAVPDGTPSHPRQASAAAALANASSSGSGNGNGANGDGVAAPAAAGSGNGAGPGRGVERVPSGSTPAINVASGSAGDGGSSDGRGEPRGGRPEGLPALPAAGPTTPTLPGPARPAAGDGGVAPLAPAASLGSGAGLGSGPAFGSGGVPGTSGDPGAGGGTGRAPGMPTPGGWFYASAPASEASPSGPAPSGAAPSSPTQFGGRLGGPAMPAGPGLTGIAGLTGRPSGQTGAVEASRTASGLTKRARRPGEPRPAASVPSDDLLASLARHNANLRVGDRAALAPLASAPTSPNRPPLAGRDPRGPGGIGGYPPPGGMPGAPPAGTPSGRMPTGPARERGPAGGPSPGPGIGGPMGPGSGVPGVPAPGPSLPGAPGAGDPGTGSRGGFGTGTGAHGAFGPSTGGPGNGGPGPSAFGNPTAPGGRGPGNGGPVAGGPLPGPGSAPGGYGPGGGPPPAGAQWSPGLHGGQGARPRSVPDGGAWPSQAGQPAAAPPQRPAPLLGHPGAPPVDAAPPPAGGATTAGGLARRVRGAQMPTSRTPVNISRAAEDIPSTPPPTARDVYGFLTSFSEGVQRGLDDVRGDEGRPPRG